MTEARRTAASTSGPTAETILALIEVLSAPEMCKLFDALNSRVRDRRGSVWWYVDLLARANEQILEKKAEGERELETILARSEEAIQDMEDLKTKYVTGPRTRSPATQRRRQLVREMLEAGADNPHAICRALGEIHGIPVKVKTVQNDLSKIRNRQA